MDGKGQSLEEVEAGIRNMRQQNRPHHSHISHNHHGLNSQMNAFDDFVSIEFCMMHVLSLSHIVIRRACIYVCHFIFSIEI